MCKQDEERLERLRTHPSLDEGVSFVSEIRCLRLWPQLQTIMDGLSSPSRGSATSRPSGGDATPSSDIASAPGTTSAALNDACKRDEDRLAQLQANPSVQAAIRFDSELKCPSLQPQLPAILNQLSKTGKVEAANQQAPEPDTMSTRAAAPSASLPPALELTSATSDDGCKRDEERLAVLQAKPSLDEAVRFNDELRCSGLQLQVLALLDSLSQAPQSAGAPTPDGAAPGATSAREAASPASELEAETKSAVGAVSPSEALSNETTAGETAPSTSGPPTTEARSTAGALSPNGALPDTATDGAAAPATLAPPVSEATSGAAAPSSSEARLNTASAGAADTNPTSEATPPPSAAPAREATSTASNDACKQDEERLALLRTNPSSEAAMRFAQELRCETLQPELLALTGELAKPPPTPTASVSNEERGARNAVNDAQPPTQAIAIADAERRIAALESDKETLAAEVSRLQRNQAPPSAEQSVPPASPQPAPPAERSESQSASQATADAERRIAALESDKETLAAEVSRLQRNQARPSAEQSVPPASPQPATPAERSESQSASQATEDAERRIAALESDKEALAAEVNKLQHDREAPSPEQATSTRSPQLASPAERTEPQAATGAERRVAELESEKLALAAEVSKLQRDRQASSADQAEPIPPSPAAPAERSDAEPAAALASLPEGMPARVLIRYLKNNADARAQAEKLASALAAQDVAVADVRESRSAIRTELSFSYAPDETIARQIGRVVGVGPVRRLQPKDGLMVRPGTVELNLSGDSHLAVIKTTSTRESNHE
jgi:hypothetical protein